MTIQSLILLDVECTGVDPKKDRVIEVACALFDISSASVIDVYATLLYSEDNAAEHVNQIPVAALAKGHPKPETAWSIVASMSLRADAFCAHFASFDKSFTPAHVADRRPWICSGEDITWPRAGGSKSLVSLALSHGVGVGMAHRAYADVLLLAQLFSRCAELGHDLDAMIQKAMRPKAKFVALVSYDDRELAKSAGFSWHKESKQWVRTMAIADTHDLGFDVKEVA